MIVFVQFMFKANWMYYAVDLGIWISIVLDGITSEYIDCLMVTVVIHGQISEI